MEKHSSHRANGETAETNGHSAEAHLCGLSNEGRLHCGVSGPPSKTGERMAAPETAPTPNQQVSPQAEFVAPEGSVGWLVVLAATWCHGSIFAIQNSFSILHMMLISAHADAGDSATQFEIAWVGALSMGMVFLCAPLVSVSTDRFGCRATAVSGSIVAFLGLLTSSFVHSLGLRYLTYGLLFGCGCSFSFQPSLVILGHYFQRRLGLANGVVTAGSSLFSVAMPAFLKELVAPMGLERTFQILSVLMVIQASLAALTFRPLLPAGGHRGHCRRDDQPCHLDNSPGGQQQGQGTDGREGCVPSNTQAGGRGWHGRLAQVRGSFSLAVFGEPTYRVWACGVAIAVLGYFVPYVHLMGFVEEQFHDSAVPEWVVLVGIGASSGVGRLLFGCISDLLPGVKKMYLHAVSLLMLGLATVLIPQCVALEGLVAVCVLLGLCDGCFISLMAPVAFQLVGPRRASQGIGLLLGIMAVPMTAGPPLAGLLHDHFGNYHMTFYLAGASPMVGAVLLLLVPCRHRSVGASQPGTSSGIPGAPDCSPEDGLPPDGCVLKRDSLPGMREEDATHL